MGGEFYVAWCREQLPVAGSPFWLHVSCYLLLVDKSKMWRRSIWWLMLAITCHFYVKSQEDYYNYKEYDADDECPDPVTNCDGFPYNSECAWHQNKHHIENFNFKYNFSVYNSSDLKGGFFKMIKCCHPLISITSSLLISRPYSWRSVQSRWHSVKIFECGLISPFTFL